VVEVAKPWGEASDLLDDEVDGFGAAVGDAGGVEAGQYPLFPSPQGAAEPGDLGDRSAGGAGDSRLFGIRHGWVSSVGALA